MSPRAVVAYIDNCRRIELQVGVVDLFFSLMPFQSVRCVAHLHSVGRALVCVRPELLESRCVGDVHQSSPSNNDKRAINVGPTQLPAFSGTHTPSFAKHSARIKKGARSLYNRRPH